jgi:type VI protein secretion system component VasF
MQVEALELFMWGTLVALTLIFLGLSVMLWRDID